MTMKIGEGKPAPQSTMHDELDGMIHNAINIKNTLRDISTTLFGEASGIEGDESPQPYSIESKLYQLKILIQDTDSLAVLINQHIGRNNMEEAKSSISTAQVLKADYRRTVNERS